MPSRRELLKILSTGVGGLLIPSRASSISLDNLLGRGFSTENIPSFAETIKVNFPRVMVEPVENYGPLGLSGFRIPGSTYDYKIYSNYLVFKLEQEVSRKIPPGSIAPNDSIQITDLTIDGVPHPPLIFGATEGRMSSNIIMLDLSTGTAVNLTEPLKQIIDKSTGIGPNYCRGRIDDCFEVMGFDVNRGNIAVSLLIDQKENQYGTFHINPRTGEVTRVSDESNSSIEVGLEGRVVVFGENHRHRVSAIDLNRIDRGIYNLSAGFVGTNDLEYTGNGLAIIRNAVYKDLKSENQPILQSSQLFVVDLDKLGTARIGRIRRPITPKSKEFQYVIDVVGEDVIYGEDPRQNSKNYFVTSLRTGKSRRISELEKERTSSNPWAGTPEIYNPSEGGLRFVSVKMQGMDSQMRISDPAHSAQTIIARDPVPGNRVAFTANTLGRNHVQYVYILNLR